MGTSGSPVSVADPRHPINVRRYIDAAKNAMYRCHSPRSKNWPNYGGRGIEFRFPSLEEFARYISLLPHSTSYGRSIDRIDNDGHYEPGNLRWATRKQQAANSRRYVKGNHEKFVERFEEAVAIWTPETRLPRLCKADGDRLCGDT